LHQAKPALLKKTLSEPGPVLSLAEAFVGLMDLRIKNPKPKPEPTKPVTCLSMTKMQGYHRCLFHPQKVVKLIDIFTPKQP
jgi:hypothetical protein